MSQHIQQSQAQLGSLLTMQSLADTFLTSRPPGQGKCVRKKTNYWCLTKPMLVQELKGNIRVFCRVRPLVAHDALAQSAAVDQLLQFPSSGPDPLCYTMHDCLLVSWSTVMQSMLCNANSSSLTCYFCLNVGGMNEIDQLSVCWQQPCIDSLGIGAAEH